MATLWLVFSTRGLVFSADRNAARQLRAYVGVGAKSFNFLTRNEANPSYVPLDPQNLVAGTIFEDFLTVTVENFGQTPAYEVMVFCHVIAVPYPGRISIVGNPVDVMPEGETRGFLSRFTIHPRQTAVSTHPIMDVRQIVAARRQHSSLFAIGRIYYKDAFGKSWRTRFCYAWEPWYVHGARFVPYEEYNDEDQTSFIMPIPPPPIGGMPSPLGPAP